METPYPAEVRALWGGLGDEGSNQAPAAYELVLRLLHANRSESLLVAW